MNNKIHNLVSDAESKKYATDAGRIMHAKLQSVRLGPTPAGDADLIEKIMSAGDELKSFFGPDSKSEVPIAGFVNGRFISRRIDRLAVDDAHKTIRILDYKTDTDAQKFREKYVAQIHEYVALMKQIYPEYNVHGYILWLHNWQLESI